MKKPYYNLRISDFVPITGALDYFERNEEYEKGKNCGEVKLKEWLLSAYNSIFIGGAGIVLYSWFSGLEKLLK